MNKGLKYGLIAVAVIIVIVLVLPLFINANTFRPTIEEKLSAALGRKVQVGNLSLSIFSGSLGADNFSVADDPRFSNSPFLTAKTLRVGVEVWPLITSKQLNLTGLTIDNPEVHLVRNQQSQWNFSTLGGAGSEKAQKTSGQALPDFNVAKLQLKDGRATVATLGSSRQSVYSNVNFDASDVSLKKQFPATLTADLPGGGTFRIEGKLGPMNPADAALTALDTKVTIKSLDLAKTGFVDPSTGIAGVVDVTNTLVSNNGTAHAKGTLTGNRLQLVKGGAPSGVPLNVDFGIDYNLTNSSGRINECVIKIGKAVAHLTGTFQQKGEDTIVNLKLDGQGMPVTELEAALPAVGVILPKGSSLKSGTANANLTIEGPASTATTTGSVGLFNAQLANFDLGSKLSAISQLTGRGGGSPNTTIEKFTANVRISPTAGTEANNIDAVVQPLGSMTGSGTVSPSGAMNFHMVANVNSSGALGGLPGVKQASSGGSIKVPIAIEGTTSDPKFIPDTSAIAKGAIEQQLGGALGQKGQLPSNPAGALGGLFGGKKKK